MDNKFNIRVYGICISKGRVLLSDERIKGFAFTKFPGGGLEFGEGTRECLIREMREESGQEFNVISHFYTTDFFQESAFHPGHQIISIYYLMEGPEPDQDQILLNIHDFPMEGDVQYFRWVDLDEFSEEKVTFPIDKKVAAMIKKQFS